MLPVLGLSTFPASRLTQPSILLYLALPNPLTSCRHISKAVHTLPYLKGSLSKNQLPVKQLMPCHSGQAAPARLTLLSPRRAATEVPHLGQPWLGAVPPQNSSFPVLESQTAIPACSQYLWPGHTANTGVPRPIHQHPI